MISILIVARYCTIYTHIYSFDMNRPLFEDVLNDAGLSPTNSSLNILRWDAKTLRVILIYIYIYRAQW